MIPKVVTFNDLDGRIIKLNQSILDFVAIRNLRSATQSLHAARDSASDARDLVVLAVAGSYLQIVTTQARIVAVRALVESERAVYQQSSDQLKAGVAVLVDVTRTQVQYQTDLQLLRSETADVEKLKLNLSRIIGLPLGSSLTVTDDFPYVPLQDLTVEDSLKRAVTARSDLQAAMSNVRAAESALAAARSEYLPNLSFTGDYGFIGTNPSQAISTYTITGSIKVPIFAGGRVQGDTAQARAALNQRKAEVQDTLGGIDHDVRTAFIDLSSAADQISKAQVDQAVLNLSYCRIYAPVSGVIGNKSVEIGATVSIGQELFDVTPIDDLWVTANFKETQLRKIRPGQSVRISVDTLGKNFDGYIESMPGATGARYSLLPPDNATGNYVKVVQRLPVRIRLKPNQDGANLLRIGMSVEPKVFLK